MKDYIEKLKYMYGDWDDFKSIIESQSRSTIKNDFIDIIKALPEDCIVNFFSLIENYGDKEIIVKNIDGILQYLSLCKKCYKITIEKTLDYLVNMKNPIIDNSISNHLISILEGPYSKGNLWTIFRVYPKYKNIGDFKKIIEERFDDILRVAFSDNDYIKNNSEIFEYISKLISDIALEEKISLSDISYLGDGKDSQCIKIGNYAFKYGKGRILDELKHHKRILKSLLRQNFPENYEQLILEEKINREDVFAIEIQPIIQENWYVGLSNLEIEENLYTIFKELMDDGIEWSDVKVENVGKIKDSSEIEDGLVIFDTQRLFSVDNVPEFEEWKLKDTLYKKFKDRYYIEKIMRK